MLGEPDKEADAETDGDGAMLTNVGVGNAEALGDADTASEGDAGDDALREPDKETDAVSVGGRLGTNVWLLELVTDGDGSGDDEERVAVAAREGVAQRDALGDPVAAREGVA